MQLRPLLGQQLAQHRHEAVDGVGRPAVGAGQPADRVVRAVHLRVAVDEEQDGAGRRSVFMGVHSQTADRVYHWPSCSTSGLRARAGLVAALLVAGCLAAAGCRGGGLFRQYEYDEDIYLSLDGSATIYVNGSLPALAALRGATTSTSRPSARFDRDRITALYASPGVRVVRVTSSRRHGRRFAHVRLEVDDIRRLAMAPAVLVGVGPVRPDGRVVPLPRGARRVGEQQGGRRRLERKRAGRLPPAPAEQDRVPQRGQGQPAARQHPALGADADRAPCGRPLEMEARMEPTSILYRTLWLFVGSMLAAFSVLAAIIWWVVKRAKGRMAAEN